MERNVERLILAKEGSLRAYMEYVLLSELTKVSGANRILASLGNGRKRNSEIERSAGMPANGLASVQLKALVQMQVITRT